MTYQSLYRRYRPQRFSEIRGQEHLVTALRNAVREGRVGHAYLLSGPRGTGKTTTARILAKALNCPNLDGGEPCGECESCRSIQHGTSFDVHELDAASNNKVEEIRDLISKAALGTPGRSKVYILDEVHMLTTAASNALLKTLEEPPDHVVFVLATTDPQKVLPTIRSRTQHLEVHLLNADELTALAEFIITDAQLDVPEGTVPYVVSAGAGSARDMESALDQVVAAGGLPGGSELLDELVDAIADRDTGRALMAVDAAIQAGKAPRALGDELMGRLRDVFLSSMRADLARLPDEERVRVTDQAKRLGPRGATRALETLGDAFVGIQDAPDPRITLEVALVRMTRPEADVSPAALLERIELLEQGTFASPGSQTTPPAPRDASQAQAVPDTGTKDRRESPTAGSPEPASAGAARPADGARESLTRTRSRRATTGSTRTPKPKLSPTKEPDTKAVESTRDRTKDRSTSATPGDLPSRDELALAWGDSILAGLKGKAKARFGAGRWVEVDSAAVYALPNTSHRDRCEDFRADVEAALEAHFGKPIPIRLVLDHDATDTKQETAERLPEESEIDVSELVDASGAGPTSIDRISEVFPGSELVEED